MLRYLFLISTCLLALGLNPEVHSFLPKVVDKNSEETTDNVILIGETTPSDLEFQTSPTNAVFPPPDIKINWKAPAWISPSKLWNQLGFPTAPSIEELLLTADVPSPPQNNIDVSAYNLESLDGIIYGSLVCRCGLPAGRIVGKGAEKARINDIPWTAAIVEKNGWPQPFCGASLINDRYVVTAAHCVSRRKPEQLVIWLNEEDILLSNETTGGRLEYEVVEIMKHPSSKGYINDIALLKLNDTVKLGLSELRIVNPVCIPVDNTKDFADETGIVAGWGRTSSGGEVSESLLKIEVPILPNQICVAKSKYKEAIRDTMMCAGKLESGDADACQGDSGGPLIVHRNQTGAVLVGIVSWGFGCGEPFSPGVYTRVSHYTEWILENTQDAQWCHAPVELRNSKRFV